ncbi:MAG: UDP-3-O-acyl-N-acetylglucosamine deacetylase, partial [Chthonomonadales bacterium]
GLALGGSMDNALIIYQDRFSDDLRVPEECVRHKMLDLIGDLSLTGFPVAADIVAVRPGHRINSAFAGLLSQAADL